MMRSGRGVQAWVLGVASGLVLLTASSAGLAAGPSGAGSDDSGDIDQARQVKDITRAGIAQYKRGNLAEARAEFAKAWALKPSTELAAMLAEVEMKLGQFDDAAPHWEYYIQNLPPDRAEAELQLAECRRHLGSVRVAVDTAGAIVSLDGEVLGPAPLRVDIWVGPGTHTFAARVPGSDPVSQQVTIAEGEAQMVTLMLQSSVAQKPAASPPADSPPPAKSDQGGGVSAKAVVVIGGSVLSLAAVGVGVVFTVKSNSAANEADTLLAQIAEASDPGLAASNSYCSPPAPAQRPAQCATYSSKLEDSKSAKSVAIASYITGGALAVGTLATALLWPAAKADQAGIPRPIVGASPRELRLGVGMRF